LTSTAVIDEDARSKSKSELTGTKSQIIFTTSEIPRGIKTSTAVGKTTRIGEQPTVAYHAEKYSMKQVGKAIVSTIRNRKEKN